MLALADTSEVTEEVRQKEGETIEGQLVGSARRSRLRTAHPRTPVDSTLKAEKLDTPERNFQDYKQVISKAIADSNYASGVVVVDDLSVPAAAATRYR